MESQQQYEMRSHFLRTYDGNTYDTPSGFVYWRTN